ncbi:ABC transporter ATP-binding protein [Mycetocola sp. JXN-3]|uniref:ABC transporter ATP-binding protein n=1 Tax=Mycetocola sp. JXN-3 TaxID=2116510 RepID=UPI001CAA887B|nr:ABC transporter ATP-binding protein [Mycetocola sp. JXN-3]
MSAPVHIRAVEKTFEGAKRASTRILNEVTLTAPAGQITTILGESGCGKTTLLRIVAGLESATGGSVHIGERDVTSVHPSRRGVAMVFQNYGLYPAKTVGKNIEFPLKMAGVPTAQRHTRALAAARLLHIDHVMDRLPAQLSGGQRQRVGIARALARDPEILLMDEPLSNLDAQLRIEMRAELVAMQRRIGSTMLYVTHDQTEAMTMSDRVVVMRGGHIEQQGTPEEVFRVPETTYVAAFLGNMNLAPAPASETGAGAGITLGVRPEHFLPADRVAAEPGDLHIEGRVEFAELLGTDRILHLRAGDTLWRARVDAALPLHEEITVVARAANIHRFDTVSGVRVAA